MYKSENKIKMMQNVNELIFHNYLKVDDNFCLIIQNSKRTLNEVSEDARLSI